MSETGLPHAMQLLAPASRSVAGPYKLPLTAPASHAVAVALDPWQIVTLAAT